MQGTIKKISREQFILLSTGEVKDFKHTESRADNVSAVKISMRKLRDLINHNVRDVRRCRWITLTYAENMTDTKRLYTDFEKFIKRFRYKYGRNVEYIVAMEPQERGAWHAHLIAIFPNVAPFIPNAELRELWGQGFVKVTDIDENIDNIGLYLTVYLTDVELTPENSCKDMDIKTVEIDGKKKRFIKGGRLKMYPPKFRLFRYSKGLKMPESEVIREHELQMRVKDCPITYENAVELTLEDGDTLTIYYRYYNLKHRKAPAYAPKPPTIPTSWEQLRLTT